MGATALNDLNSLMNDQKPLPDNVAGPDLSFPVRPASFLFPIPCRSAINFQIAPIFWDRVYV